VHPHTFYANQFNHEKRDEVFVVIPFNERFHPRWRDVIEPCIREDLGLRAVRVDENVAGETTVHQILDGIAHARLVIVDITSTPTSTKKDEPRPLRNANVMWELGVAHVMRLPDEVLVVRSDTESTPFDLTQFRPYDYDPREPIEARRVLKNLAKGRLAAIDHGHAAHVLRLASSLDYLAFEMLLSAYEGRFRPHRPQTTGEFLIYAAKAPAMTRLFQHRLLRATFPTVTVEDLSAPHETSAAELMEYEITELGKAVIMVAGRQLVGSNPDPALVDRLANLDDDVK
jgi:hypothetical protein